MHRVFFKLDITSFQIISLFVIWRWIFLNWCSLCLIWCLIFLTLIEKVLVRWRRILWDLLLYWLCFCCFSTVLHWLQGCLLFFGIFAFHLSASNPGLIHRCFPVERADKCFPIFLIIIFCWTNEHCSDFFPLNEVVLGVASLENFVESFSFVS